MSALSPTELGLSVPQRTESEINLINDYLLERVKVGMINIDAQKAFFAILPDRGLSDSEREAVAESFVEAGWSRVESKTSAENDERPGLIQWTLYR